AGVIGESDCHDDICHAGRVLGRSGRRTPGGHRHVLRLVYGARPRGRPGIVGTADAAHPAAGVFLPNRTPQVRCQTGGVLGHAGSAGRAAGPDWRAAGAVDWTAAGAAAGGLLGRRHRPPDRAGVWSRIPLSGGASGRGGPGQQRLHGAAGSGRLRRLVCGGLHRADRDAITPDRDRHAGLWRCDPSRGPLQTVTILIASAAGISAAQWVLTAVHRATAAVQSALARVRGLPPEITVNEQFYVVSKNPPGFDPVVEVARWALDIGGLVGAPVRLSLGELRAMPAVEQLQTLECISNEVGGDLISNAKWKGVPLRDVLMRAGGPAATAVKVAFRCADGYSESIPLTDAMHPSTLLVYEMNG